MCRHRELDQTCEKLKDYPKISPLSRGWLSGIMKLRLDLWTIRVAARGNQWQWFIDGLGIVRQPLHKKKCEKLKKDQRKTWQTIAETLNIASP